MNFFLIYCRRIVLVFIDLGSCQYDAIRLVVKHIDELLLLYFNDTVLQEELCFLEHNKVLPKKNNQSYHRESCEHIDCFLHLLALDVIVNANKHGDIYEYVDWSENHPLVFWVLMDDQDD